MRAVFAMPWLLATAAAFGQAPQDPPKKQSPVAVPT